MKAHGRVCVDGRGSCVCGWADEVGEGRRLWGVVGVWGCLHVCSFVLVFI